ncbi:hypothetical protein GDO81_004821 [Engystomops pustulosus]|uniref:USP domain-containing protein n=2 Tax=Engystomops pustulosus TaxID=76066 RepID=A0AAV7CJG9_ENGPU|nr:hypothetical protein GDO81_004821 [Engystomops pustulosus]
MMSITCFYSLVFQGSLTCPKRCWQVTCAMTKINQWVTTMASKTPGSSVSLVGQGSFLDKPSLHMVGYMGESPPAINAPHDGCCPVCKAKGQTQALKTYRINFTQSIFLCSNPQCIYPLGYTPLDNIIANTADLKKNGSPKKRNFSDGSVTSLPCEKRPKIDQPIVCDSRRFQADQCKLAPEFPSLQSGMSLQTRLQHDQNGGAATRVQNVSGTTSSSPALLDMSGLSMGSLGKCTPDLPNGVSVVQNSHEEVLQNGNLAVIDTSNSVLPLVPEAEMDLNAKEVKEKVTEKTESLNDKQTSNGLDFQPDHIPARLSTSMLQNSQQDCQAGQISTKEMPLPQSSTNARSDLESELSASYGNISNLGLIEPTKEQSENKDDVEASPCIQDLNSSIQDGCVENKVFLELPCEQSDQHISFMAEITPPTCPEAPVQDKSFGSAELSEHPGAMQEMSVKTTPQKSLDDVLLVSPAEDHSIKDLLQAAPSPPCLVGEESAKSPSTLPSCDSEEPSKGISDMNLTSPVPEESIFNPEDQLIRLSNLLQEPVQECKTTNSEEQRPSKVSEDDQSESQKALMDTLAPSEDHSVAEAIPLPANLFSMTHDACPSGAENDLATPADPLIDAGNPDNSSLEKDCEPQDTTSVREDCNTHTDAKSPSKVISPAPKVLLQDCLKCRCGMSLQKTTCNNPTTSEPCAEISTSGLVNKTNHDDKSPKIMSLPAPKILLQDCMKCHCQINLPSASLQKTLCKNSTSEDCSSLYEGRAVMDTEKALAQTDSCVAGENTKTTVQERCELLLSQQKKRFYEKTILPDLLMDIQPEHRMEESSSAVPSPTSEPTVSVPLPSCVEEGKQEAFQNGQVKESSDNELMDVLNGSIHDGSKSSDNFEASINSDGLDNESDEMESKSQDAAEVNKTPPTQMNRRLQRRLQWQNKYSLCWLDCIMSAMVHSETLKHLVAKGHHRTEDSIIHRLFTKYQEASSMLLQKTKRNKVYKRPRYSKCLEEVRMEVFEKIKSPLKCDLGNKESPVFAFPILLKEDPEVEKLFLHSILWQFNCENCGFSYQRRCRQALTTFTQILPEWHPLNAVHMGPCSVCRNTQQRRSMVLENLNAMFMVHFVEGLPSNDLNKYSFQFHGHLYEVKEVIKYKNDHFSTWIANPDGSWLESDDLRGQFCRRNQKFLVRADDIHILIWERKDVTISKENVELGPTAQDPTFYSSNAQMASEDLSASSEAAAPLPQQVTPSPSVVLNTSDPLAGMEGYAADDVITLTLVEIPLDANGRPVETQTELQAPATCTAPVEANQGASTHITQLDTSANAQLSSQEDNTCTSAVSPDSNKKTSPIKDCSVIISPIKQSALKPPATSTPLHPPFIPKKSGVTNWMTRIVNKDQSIISSAPNAANLLKLKAGTPLKVTDANSAAKKAQSFNGFQGRSSSKTSLLTSSIFPGSDKPTFSVPKDKTSGYKKTGSSGLDYKKLLKEGSSTSEDKIRKLRLKLLKKLKAKKNELATLEMLSKKQQGGPLNGQAYSGFNRKDHLQGFLKELQDQIDNADNESVCTMSSSASICSSPGDAEFFAELFSPSPVDNQLSDGSYLEMLADGCGVASAGQLPQANGQAGATGVLQATSSTSYPTTSPLNHSESLNIMSSSTLNVPNEDNGYFDFDDYF